MEKMETLTVIQETEILGRKIKMYGSIEHPLFLASDVAEWIDYSKSNGKFKVTQMVAACDDGEKGIYIVDTLGGQQKKWFLTEDGLYEICMQSRKPIAKEMKKEIKAYLKQIRLTGGAVEMDREEEFVKFYFPSISDETKLALIQDLRKQNIEYKQRIDELELQAQAYIDLMTAQGYLQFIDVAAMVETGRTKLLAFLRECKVLTKQSNFNVPYGRFASNGMFKVVTAKNTNGNVSSVTMVSPKGLDFIYKLMQKKNVLDEFDAASLLSKIQELGAA